MADLLFILITSAFIAVCVGYVRWCDRIIGPDEWAAETVERATDGEADAPREAVAA